MLTDLEKIRYKRQLLIEDWGLESQEHLKNMTVFVAGAGGSGSPIITQLALLGVGCIRICDFDVVDLSNLNRQFIHCVSEKTRLGMNKALSAKMTAENINPHVKVEVFTEEITEDNIDEMIGDASIVFDSVDKINVKFILSKAAMRKRIPHLFYGMMDLNGFVSIFNPPETPCFHCLFDYEKVEMVESISMDPDQKSATPVCCPPVLTTAGFAMTEAVKIMLGLGKPAYNKYFLFLHKGDERIGDSHGFLGMRFWITEYFEEISLQQGYDWDEGWNGNWIEVLDIAPNPECPHCSQMRR